MRNPIALLRLRRAFFVTLSLLPWVAAYALGMFLSGFSQRPYTPLMNAARENRVADVKALLAQGADVHEQAVYGWTALWVAVDTRNVALAKLLIDAGANVNERFDNGLPLLMIGVSGANRAGRSPEMVELLLAHGADVRARSLADGNSVLHYASSVDLVRLLIQAGADVNASSCGGNVPLALKVGGTAREPPRGDLAVIRVLLEAGARPTEYAAARIRELAANANDGPVLALLNRAPAIVPTPYRDGPCRLPPYTEEKTNALKAWGDRRGIVLSHKGWDVVRGLPMNPITVLAPTIVLFILAMCSQDWRLARWSGWAFLFLFFAYPVGLCSAVFLLAH